ncbi:MAG: Uncharacterised protein [SAR116 cluster bacterium]|nr:MAG: Uncharacterised protein [SAR116 cluster bacterium]
MTPIFTMGRDGQPVIGVGKHVFGIVDLRIGKEAGAGHCPVIFNQALALFANHPVPVPDQIPEGEIMINRPAP